MKIGAVMIYVNNVDLTETSLMMLKRSTCYEGIETHVLLFHNGGDETDQEQIMKLSDDCFIIHFYQLPVNVGLIKIRNLGVEACLQMGCDYTLVCDNDTLFGDGWLPLCLGAFEKGFDVVGENRARFSVHEPLKDWFWSYSKCDNTDFGVVYVTDVICGYFIFFKTGILKRGATFDDYWVHNSGYDEIESIGGGNDDLEFCLQCRIKKCILGSMVLPIYHIGGVERNITTKDIFKTELAHQGVQKMFYAKWKGSELDKPYDEIYPDA